MAIGTWTIGLFAVASGALLLIGFLTPVASTITGAGGLGFALSWLPAARPNLFEARLSIIFVVIMATGIILLGPGAFSLDARLFGRREIVIPRSSHSQKS